MGAFGRQSRFCNFFNAILYVNFHLTLSVSNGLGRWDYPAACRR